MVAIALMIAGTIGAIFAVGGGDRRAKAVLDQTFRPVPSAAAVLVPRASPLPNATASPTPVAIVFPSLPTVAPIVPPSPKVTSKPTAAPARGPATPSPRGPARDPAETVDDFYHAIDVHDYAAAAALWSPRMRGEYPPSRYIAGRFDATTRIDMNRLRIERVSLARRRQSCSWISRSTAGRAPPDTGPGPGSSSWSTASG